jgi:hypothetical protein
MIFELATRKKFRFKMDKGFVTTEDLWDLKLEDLNRIAVSLNKQIKESSDESFIKTKSSADKDLQAHFDVVKHIIDVKLAEKEAKLVAIEREEKRERLRDLIAKKELSALESKTLDELRAELDSI